MKILELDVDLQTNLSLIKNNSVYNTNENVEYTNLGEDYLKTINLNNNIQYIPELDMDTNANRNYSIIYKRTTNEININISR